MKVANVIAFEKLLAQAQGLQEEFSDLSRKKSDAPVSAFKLKLVNAALAKLNAVLGTAYAPFDDFAEFDLDDVPTVSDVAMILGQYLECAETMRSFNIENVYENDWRWQFEDDPQNLHNVRTAPPKNLSRKR